MEGNTSTRQQLLHRVQVCSFVLVETGLFLDTHPDCAEALAFYQKHLEMKRQAEQEYIQKFGPLSATDYNGGPTWQWVDDPWPWERGV